MMPSEISPPSVDTMRVMIVEDDVLLRSLLKRAIDREADMSLVGTAETLPAARDLLAREHPQLILLDLRLGPMATVADGWELFEQWSKTDPSIRWIVVTGQPEAANLRRALGAGVQGYVTKNEPFEVLLAALREVREGRQYYSVGALQLLMDQPVQSPGLAQLTPRERDVLRAAGDGLSVRQAAARLEISETTVKTHRKNLMRKLDVHDAVGLARYAIGAGLAT